MLRLSPLTRLAIRSTALLCEEKVPYMRGSFPKFSKSQGHCCTAALKPEYYEYVLQHTGESPAQVALRKKGDTQAQPYMMASPDQYQFLAWFCATMNAKKVLEVGTFRGVTTLAIAKALPADGKIYTLDLFKSCAEHGMKIWEQEGVSEKIEFIEGNAVDSMKQLLANGAAGTFDFIFIDANKDGYPAYYELSVELARPGGVIAVDNTLMHGDAVEEYLKPTGDKELNSILSVNDRAKKDPRVSSVMSILADGTYFVRKL